MKAILALTLKMTREGNPRAQFLQLMKSINIPGMPQKGDRFQTGNALLLSAGEDDLTVDAVSWVQVANSTSTMPFIEIEQELDDIEAYGGAYDEKAATDEDVEEYLRIEFDTVWKPIGYVEMTTESMAILHYGSTEAYEARCKEAIG